MERVVSLSEKYINEVVTSALAEDLGQGDVTTDALIPAGLQGRASFVSKASGIVAGLEVSRAVFLHVDSALQVTGLFSDGARIKPGDVLGHVSGATVSILKAERTALNFLQRMSGIATETSRYVEAVAGLSARITDTRKTTPGLRLLEKYAVRAGGGVNHRLNLGDMVLIKDNHIAALRAKGMTLRDIILQAKRRSPPGMKVEVEVTIAEEAAEAATAGADTVMLDNMGVEDMRRAVKLVKGKILIEASGGITLDNVRSVAETGVDYISVGALTHSVRALDISLEMEG
ncbi:MAG: carboxylating nicotinate-nucleotide diphosphorylase [Dehalococcoidia bacterium]|nr:carboxylating nicotinate-nucleotide diphosphorylase [Dehalococcoidia bacterium]